MRRAPAPRLLTPPREEEEIYPYRRVWPRIVIEGMLLFGITLLVYFAVNILGIDIPTILLFPVNFVLAVMPALLWLLFSYLPERRVLQPRRRLIVVAVVSGLVANAIGIPLLNDYLQVDEWLSLGGVADRIFGYTFTVGIVQEVLKYMVVRYFVWPERLRIHLDAVAYAAASAVGYVTVVNLHLIAEGAPPDVIAIRVFGATALHIATTVIVAYGLAGSRFGTTAFMVLPFTLFLAALLTGIAVPLRSGLVNAQLVQGIGATNVLFGLGFAIILYVVPLLGAAFFFSAQESRQQEAAASREV